MFKIGHVYLFLSLLVSCHSVAAIRDNPFESITELSGHTFGMVHALEVDKGTIWVGADNGLFKIIGSHSEKYTNESLESPISSLLLSSSDLWVGTYGSGLYRFTEPNIGRSGIQKISNFQSKFILSIERINETRILVRTYDGLFDVKAFDNETIEVYSIYEGYTFGAMTSEGERVYVYTNDGLGVLDLTDQNFSIILPAIKEKTFKTFVKSKDGDVAALYSNRLILLDLGKQEEIKLNSKTNSNFPMFDALHLEDGGYLIASEQFSELSNRGMVSPSFYEPFLTNSTLNVVYDIKKTSSGNVLFGGPVFGVTWLPENYSSIAFLHEDLRPITKRFTSYEKFSDSNSLMVFSGDIYVTTDQSNSRLVPIESDTTWHSIKNTELGLIGADESGSLWSFGVDVESNSIFNQKSIYTEGNIVEIEAFKNTLLYINAQGQLFSTSHNGSKLLTQVKDVAYAFSTSDIFAIIDEENGLHITYNLEDWFVVDTSKFSTNLQLECMSKSPSGVLYFCTSGHGILRLDGELMTLVPAEINQSIDSLFIRAISIQENGIGWVASNSGLYRFSINNGIVQKLKAKEGIIDTDFEYEGILLDETSDRLYVVGDNLKYKFTLSSLNEHMNKRQTKTHDVVTYRVSNFSASGEEKGTHQNFESYDFDEYVEIHSDVYLTELFFTSLDPIDHKYLSYEYRLLGLSDQWKLVNSLNAVATYSSLPFGQYEFQVRAVDTNSSTIQPISKMKINVLPPFWLTNVAFYTYALLITLAVFGLKFWFRKRRNNLEVLKREFAKEETSKINSLLLSKNSELSKIRLLLGSISHEIRTPLTLIIGRLKSVLKRLTNEENRTLVYAALSGTKRLNLLVDQILNIHELKEISDTPHTTVNTSKTLSSLVDIFKPISTAKNVSIILKGRSGILISAKGSSFETICSHLLINAIQSAPENSEIYIHSKVRLGELKIAVSDSGQIVANPKVRHIFDRNNLDTSNSIDHPQEIRSLILEELVKLNNGKIKVECKAGQSFQVTISFPQINSSHAEEAASIDKSTIGELQYLLEPSESSQNSIRDYSSELLNSGEKVLIVDGSAEMRNYITSILEHKYLCFSASNGKEALDIANLILPSLIIADVNLPLLGGIALTQTLRASERNSKIPIILLSAQVDSSTRIACLQSEVNDFIAKPFDARELLLKVRNLMKLNSIKREKSTISDIEETIDVSEFNLPTFEDEKDKRFYTKFLLIIQKHYQDDKFDREHASKLLNCADRHLNRKLNSIAGHTFAPFLRQYRLKKASKLLLLSDSVSNVAFDSGFSSASHFGSCFRDEFGMTPTQYIKRNKKPLEG